MNIDTTICALATSAAPSGVAIIRLSGPETKNIISKVFKGKKDPVSCPRELIYGKLFNPENNITQDHALVVFFKGPSSFTGEDLAEFHIHGSPLLAQNVLRNLFSVGAEPAKAGEFTQRAFENGKLDLIQAEAVGDIISASSEMALKVAREQLEGKLSNVIDVIGEPLRDNLSEIEANIDFPEEDINPDTIDAIKTQINKTKEELKVILNTFDYGQIIREGYRVLICGRPNAGKSSLLNQLLETQRAIVTNISGTTRDLIEENALINGYKFVFCDSAGITTTDDEVEKIGIELAISKVDWADLVLLVVDANEGEDEFQEIIEILNKKVKNICLVVNKIDQNQSAIGKLFCDTSICRRNIYISALDGTGISKLKEVLVDEVISTLHNQGESSVIVTNERQRSCLNNALKSLEETLNAIENNMPLEIISADLRNSLLSLEEIIGKTHTEDILGRIFSKFCIGK